MKLLSHIFLIYTLITVIGCSGWHLRGSNAQFKSTNLSNAVFLAGQRSATYNATLTLLKSQGLLATANNNFLVELGQERWSSRTASLNTSGLAAETEISLSVPYKISRKQTNGQNTILANTQAEISRSYTADNNDIGAKEKEENELRTDMNKTAARAIIRRLSLLSSK